LEGFWEPFVKKPQSRRPWRAALASIPSAKPQSRRPWRAALASIPSATHRGVFAIVAPIMDLIYLRDLKIECVIGIYDWERRIKQALYIDLEMAADIARAANTDSIRDTLDYKAVAKRLQQFVGESQFQLVETLAERIAEIVLTEFRVPWVRVRINKKGAVRNADAVGVMIERGTRP
jgi:dihydroneopterin aldolase